MHKKKIIVVMPGYNVAKTLRQTVEALPPGVADEIILVDNASHDETIAIGRELGLTVIQHPENRGYGGSQKTCYTEALRRGADFVVMVHPDFQYAPALLREILAPLEANEADMVLGSRFLHDQALAGGMPVWKWIGNKFLTSTQNLVFRWRLSEYHTGYRAYTRRFLETIPFLANSNGYVFDQEVMAQACWFDFRIAEVPIPTRYFPEASSIGFVTSCTYGARTLWVLGKYLARCALGMPVGLFAPNGGRAAIPIPLDPHA